MRCLCRQARVPGPASHSCRHRERPGGLSTVLTAWGKRSRTRRQRRGLRGHSRLAVAGFSVLLAASGVAFAAPAAQATASTVVALTFDNNTLSQYTLCYQQALQ